MSGAKPASARTPQRPRRVSIYYGFRSPRMIRGPCRRFLLFPTPMVNNPGQSRAEQSGAPDGRHCEANEIALAVEGQYSAILLS